MKKGTKRSRQTHQEVADELSRIANCLTNGEDGCSVYIPKVIREHFDREQISTTTGNRKFATIYVYFALRVQHSDVKNSRWALPADLDSLLRLLLLQTDEWDDWQTKLGIHNAEDGVPSCFLGLFKRPRNGAESQEPEQKRRDAFQQYLMTDFPLLAIIGPKTRSVTTQEDTNSFVTINTFKWDTFRWRNEENISIPMKEVKSNTTWGDMKKLISAQEGIDAARQSLFYNGCRLADNMRCNGYNLQHQDALYLLLDERPCAWQICQPYQPLTLEIRTLTGQRFPINCCNTTPIFLIKVLLRQCEGIPEDQQRLIWSGRQLEDGATPGMYPLDDNNTLHLVPRLQGC
eukprot:TRINITY_DN67583_c8_g6_i5.p1 TRINITY_DN67583_c8_g6~~TRINITY_DN67583_c8_g6_i5.p1  ORF type:complete len:346 (+),score=32.38 TRINITY_DN67583_c8_g6_i5:63-1100(+)